MTQRRMTDEQVARLPLSAARAELLEEIMRTDATETTLPDARGRSRHRGWLPALASAAAVAALVGAAFVVPGLGGEGGAGDTATGPVPPTASVSTGGDPTATPTNTDAEPNITPAVGAMRAWVALPVAGWTPTYVSDSSGWREVRWERGGQSLDVSLSPARLRASYVDDRSMIDAPERDPGTRVTLLGEDALMWPYSATDHTTIGAVVNRRYPEVRGSGMDRADYLALLDQLVWVDAESFYSLLPPEEFPTGTARTAWIAEMLQDVPVPDDLQTFSSLEVDRYQLGAALAGSVACAWLDRFAAAKESGDGPAAQEAQDALSTARGWRMLEEMAEQGDYPEVLWEYADEAVRGEVPEGYAGGLGCDE